MGLDKMPIASGRNLTTSLRSRIYWICGLTLVLSVSSLVIVLWFQHSEMGSKTWDFQGAAGAATVIPSFAGVILAGWAIYFQIKTSAPSYKAAEQKWLEISELYHRALRIGALLQTIEVEEPYDARDNSFEPDFEDGPPFSEINELAKTAEGLAAKRCANQFDATINRDDVNRTLASLALGVFPVLESLNSRLVGFPPVDFIRLETDIDVVGATYAANSDYHELATWVHQALSVLRCLVELIETLSANGLLNIDEIEKALIKPSLSKTIRTGFEQQDALMEWRLSQRGGVNQRPKFK